MRTILRMLEIRPGGWLLLSLLYFFGDVEWVVIVMGNVLIHELGHVYVLGKFGIRISGIQFDWTGLCIRCNETMLNRRRAFFAAAAGPAVGLFAAVLCSVTGNVLESDGLLLFSGVGVVFSCFNLLPAKPLDGWRMIRAICPALAQIISVCAALIILLAGLFCMILGYGTTLAFLGIVLLLEGPEEISARRIQYG